MNLDNITIKLIELALQEDKVRSDVTTLSLMNYDSNIEAKLISKDNGIISGITIFEEVMKRVDSLLQIKTIKQDGSRVKPKDIILYVKGLKSSILMGERVALNFLQHLSGVATLTDKFVQELKGSKSKLLDTRKTTPGMRKLEKLAVLHGGGENHRHDLEDMAMIKENHIVMAGNSITKAFEAVKEKNPNKKIEIEVKNLIEFEEAVSLGVDIIMLDNFSLEEAKKAVKVNNNRIKLELSGNVTLESIKEKGEVGVDYISSGALTHSVKSFDITLLM